MRWIWNSLSNTSHINSDVYIRVGVVPVGIATGGLGHNITLGCPRFNNDTVISDTVLSFKEWFRGTTSSLETMVATLVTRGAHVVYNHTVGEKLCIDSLDGDLNIKYLTQDDGGFYTCSFTGSKARTIQLNIITGMFDCSTYSYKIGSNKICDKKYTS